jgi:hypothetical protein
MKHEVYLGSSKIMKNHKNKAFRAIIICALGFIVTMAIQETAQAQQVTARTLDNWLQKNASPAQKARYQDFYNKIRNHFLTQNWSPGRKYNRAQADLAAYKLIRSPQYSASYLSLICGHGNNAAQGAGGNKLFGNLLKNRTYKELSQIHNLLWGKNKDVVFKLCGRPSWDYGADAGGVVGYFFYTNLNMTFTASQKLIAAITIFYDVKSGKVTGVTFTDDKGKRWEVVRR